MKKERLDIIYEDKNIIAVNKPANLLTISTEKEKEKTLYHKVSEYEKKKHKSNKVFIVHRLDKDTSGVVVFAKNQKFKTVLQNNWDKITKNREYIAIVHGKMEIQSKTIKTWLKETANYMTISSNKPNDGKVAITNYNLIDSNNKFSLLRIHILTGRKNQIRVHMKDIGNPIVGDKKYGLKKDNSSRMMLHASKLELIHPVTKQILVLEAKTPKEFYNIFNKELFTSK